MNRSELNEKAKKHLDNAGFGTGTNITLHVAKCLMVDFYLENQNETFDEYLSINDVASMYGRQLRCLFYDYSEVWVEKTLVVNASFINDVERGIIKKCKQITT